MFTTEWQISKTEAVADQGMVAAKHPLAVEAGLQVLREGGNAVDAAITTALAMGVVEPYMNGIGGGGFMLYHDAETGQSHLLDYFMTAPQAATPDMYEITQAGATDVLGFRGVKDDANYVGQRSVGVPGMVAGAAAALERFGTISLARALAPAIRLAADGFDVTWYTILMYGRSLELIARFPATAAVYLKEGRFPYSAGGLGPAERLVQKDLAATLQHIAAEGPNGFYRGPVAEAIVAELQTHGNPISLTDLAGYQPRWSEPRVISYRDNYQLLYAPNSGGGTVAEAFNILEGFDFSGLSPTDPAALHRYIEAARTAYADRWQHLADEAFVNVPWQVLESKGYAAHRRAAINPAQAAPTIAAWDGSAYLPGNPEGDGGCTTHLSVVDKDRNLVSITQTINMAWGSGVVVPGTGVLLNDSMVLFDPRPGRANSIAGGKRPLSSMAPMLVLKQGKPFLTVGAPGGRMIMGTVMQVIHNVLDWGMGIQEACAQNTLDCSGDHITVDAALGEAGLQGLTARGHKLDVRRKDFLPRLFASPTGILVNPATGKLHGGADPYHPGVAAGY